MGRSAWLLAGLLIVGACGGRDPSGAADTPQPGHWHFARVEGLAGASGLTVHESTLLAVAGEDDRDIYAIEVADVRAGDGVKARKLAVDIRPDVPLMGAETFAVQGYTMAHLWKAKLDFQGVAAQVPNLLYVVDSERRVIFWGPMHRSADGRLARVQFQHVTVAPGADRKDVGSGDWRDKGPGVRGLVSVAHPGRIEDLYLLEAGEAGKPLVIRRMDRYGSNLGGVRARHGLQGPPDARALSWDEDRLVLLVGAGRGSLMTVGPPDEGHTVSVPDIHGVPGPEAKGVDGWTGLAHAPDGSTYLVSGGSPAMIAWRAP